MFIITPGNTGLDLIIYVCCQLVYALGLGIYSTVSWAMMGDAIDYNGWKFGTREAADHFFYFEVPNSGETKLTAVSGTLKDESVIRKVDTFNEAYRLKEEGAILNWFDVVEKPGRLSLNSKMGEVLSTLRGKLILLRLMGKLLGGKKEKKKAAGFEITPDMMTMMNGFTVLRLLTMAGGMMNVKFTKEDLLKLNARLNRIKQPRKKA